MPLLTLEQLMAACTSRKCYKCLLMHAPIRSCREAALELTVMQSEESRKPIIPSIKKNPKNHNIP